MPIFRQRPTDRGGAAVHSAPPLRPHAERRPRYLALCARPTEPIVAAELRAMPEVTDVEPGAGMVAFSGPRAALYRANLHLRCASRVLYRLADVPCQGPEDLYAAARDLPWEEFLAPSGTLAVSAHGLGPGIDNSMFAALRVKDGVVDRFRERFGSRPDVDVRYPMLRINVQLYQESGRGGWRCALSLDSSDEPLYRRGYRQGAGEAPLKETLAASILALAGYPPASATPLPPLCDLCCGSGTLLIEAGLQTLGRAPGLHRRFGFMNWRDFDSGLWQRLRTEATAMARPVQERFLYGSDIDGKLVASARKNAATAGLEKACQIVLGDLRNAVPPPGPPGVVVCNPPYGERLGDKAELVDLYRALGDTLKRRFVGYTAYVFTGDLALGKQIGLKPSARHILYNGNIEGRLLRFDLY